MPTHPRPLGHLAVRGPGLFIGELVSSQADDEDEDEDEEVKEQVQSAADDVSPEVEPESADSANINGEAENENPVSKG